MAKQSGQNKIKDLSSDPDKQLSELRQELRDKNRQLEIEAALEKVRVRTTAMRGSSELAETSNELFQQLNVLRIKAIRTAVAIFDDANDAMEQWLITYDEKKEAVRIIDYVNLHIHPLYDNIIYA